MNENSRITPLTYPFQASLKSRDNPDQEAGNIPETGAAIKEKQGLKTLLSDMITNRLGLYPDLE